MSFIVISFESLISFSRLLPEKHGNRTRENSWDEIQFYSRAINT